MLDAGPGGDQGRIVALNIRDGRIRWSRDLPSPSESSPLLDGGRVFFGSQNGTVYALKARSGARLDLSRRGRREGQPDTRGRHPLLRRLLRPRSGDHRADGPAAVASAAPKARCSAAATSTPPPPSSTDGSSSATPTGASTPTTPPPAGSTGPSRRAPTCTPRPPSPTPPDSARRSTSAPTTGTSTPSTPAPATITGATTPRQHLRLGHIVGRVVYFADLGTTAPTASGSPPDGSLFQIATGAFDPVISDSDDIYLTGYSALYTSPPSPPRRPPPRNRRAPPSAAVASRGKRPAEREARLHARAPGGTEAHLRPAPRPGPHAALPPRDRPVARVVHPHEERSRPIAPAA